MKGLRFRYYSCDFETTVYEGQEYTEVWAAASAELFTDEVNVWHSLDDMMQYFITLPGNKCLYFHNLKFDGAFILDWLLRNESYNVALVEDPNENMDNIAFLPVQDMPNNSYIYSISNLGQWYKIVIKARNRIIEIRDSLKLLPFSVKQIGKAFKTNHQKLDIEYKGFRYAGCEITDEERKYIENDVLVVKEALEVMFNEKHNKITIGACCMSEFKSRFNRDDYEGLFTNIYEKESIFEKTQGDFIRTSYRGAWCYVVPGKARRIVTDGFTADANSLYPSVMHSESGNRYPYGDGYEWAGEIPTEAIGDNKYYFIRVKTRFYLKDGKLPFVQIKGNYLYPPLEMLSSSDILGEDGEYYQCYEKDGKIIEAIPELTLTCVDWKLLQQHYYLEDTEIIGGAWFWSELGLFDDYINHYRKIKEENVGALRTLAKLFLNNLYGKLAASTNSSFKFAYLEDDRVKFVGVHAEDKKPGYIPCGSAVTSYARRETILAAQANYYGEDNPGFCYADTDSIHCDFGEENLKGIKIHPTKFQCWKVESNWDKAYFVRTKRYIEHNTHEDGELLDEPAYNIKCAGMPERCKRIFESSMTGKSLAELGVRNPTHHEENFAAIRRNMNDFDKGLSIPGKLLPKRIHGGIILEEVTFEMR